MKMGELLKGENFNDSEDFIRYVDDILRDASTSIKAIFTLSNFKTPEEFLEDLKKSGFRVVSAHGIVFRLLKHSEKYGNVEYLALYTEDGNPIFFTLATKTKEIPPTLLDYLKRAKNISNLWISLTRMDELIENLKEEYKDDITATYFTGTYSPLFKRKAERRPNLTRFVEYRGDDALQSYEEFKYEYGILPRVFEFNILGYGTFRLDYQGIVVAKPRSSFSFVCQTMDEIISEVDISKEKITKAHVFDKPMKVGRKEFKTSLKFPWSVKLSEIIEVVKFEEFIKVLESEWEFLPIDVDIKRNDENSEFLDFSYFRVIDMMKPNEFSVICRNEDLKVYPSKTLDFGSSLRFFQSVKSFLDVNASLT